MHMLIFFSNFSLNFRFLRIIKLEGWPDHIQVLLGQLCKLGLVKREYINWVGGFLQPNLTLMGWKILNQPVTSVKTNPTQLMWLRA